MTAITQQVENFIQGISKQPDELKGTGQVNDLKNALPDVTLGCIKRPGSKLVSAITPSSGTLTWFHIYEDSTDQYIGNVNTSGVIQVWRTRDGASIPIDYSAVPGSSACTYLSGWTNSDEIQPLTINRRTYLLNRNTTVAMKTGTSDKSPAEVHEAIIELSSITYGKQYALDIFDPTSTATTTTNRATSIAVREGLTLPGSGYTNDGKCSQMTRETITQGTISGKTNLRVEVDIRCAPIAEGGGDASNHPNYDDSYQTFAKLQFGGEGWSTGDTFTFTTEKGTSGTIEIKTHATLTSRANIAKVRPPATSSNSEEAVTAEEILGQMKASLDAISGTGITATIVGKCLHLTRSSAFSVTTPEPALLNVVTSEVNSFGELPTHCRHNFKCKILNSGEDEDDYYVSFRADNVDASVTADRFGSGVWEECPAPNLTIKFDETTLPVSLVRELPSGSYSNGRFLVQSPAWIDRSVGDESTNPQPSFVGEKINKVLFFRNRLCMFSRENIIFSQTNDFFNFWSNSAVAVADDDPIDIQSSSTFPTKLFDGIEVNTGLLVFANNQQFMCTTDSDSFSPTTAKINSLCSYNFNSATKPFSLGTTVGFLNSTGKNARVFEMTNIRREGEPTVVEQSKIVSKLLPIGLTEPTVSKENNLLLIAEPGSSEVWGYRYYQQGDKRVQSAWFRWTFSGTITHHVILDDVYYVVLKNGSNYTLEAIDVKKQSATTLVGTSPDDYRIHLDCHSIVSSLASNTYNASTNKTTFPKPTGYNSSNQLAVYNNNAGNDVGRFGLVTVNGSNLELTGDWTGANLILGYEFEWLVELPTLFVKQAVGGGQRSDTRSSLIIHRLGFIFGSTGLIDVVLKRKGRPDYTKSYESIVWDVYNINSVNIAEDALHTVAAYERNKNLTIQLKSKHPSPASLHSLNWEGDYNTKFYKIV